MKKIAKIDSKIYALQQKYETASKNGYRKAAQGFDKQIQKLIAQKAARINTLFNSGYRVKYALRSSSGRVVSGVAKWASYGGAFVLTLDIAGRLYVWNVLDNNPGLSPLVLLSETSGDNVDAAIDQAVEDAAQGIKDVQEDVATGVKQTRQQIRKDIADVASATQENFDETQDNINVTVEGWFTRMWNKITQVGDVMSKDVEEFTVEITDADETEEGQE